MSQWGPSDTEDAMPTQVTDVNGDPFGIDYAASDLLWEVAKGVL